MVKQRVESSLERRRAVRYELNIAVAFFWEDAEGSRIQSEGVTRDISDVGVYVFAYKCPPLKGKVRIAVLLAQPGFAGTALKGSMQVLRVDRSTEARVACGFAIAGTTLSLGDAAHA
jgi:hypothetical protein